MAGVHADIFTKKKLSWRQADRRRAGTMALPEQLSESAIASSSFSVQFKDILQVQGLVMKQPKIKEKV